MNALDNNGQGAPRQTGTLLGSAAQAPAASAVASYRSSTGGAGKPKCWHGAACRKLRDPAHCEKYDHDLKPCKFGARCKRQGKGCKFLHPGQEGLGDQESLLCQEVNDDNNDNSVAGRSAPFVGIPFILTLIFIGALGLFGLPLIGFCNAEVHKYMFYAGCALVVPFPILELLLCGARSFVYKKLVAGDYAERATFRINSLLFYPERLQPLTYVAGDLKGNNIEQYATWETNNMEQQFENATGGNRDGGQVTKLPGGNFQFDFASEFCGESRNITPQGVVVGLEHLDQDVKFDGSNIIYGTGAFQKAGWWRLDFITKVLIGMCVLGVECIYVSMVMPPGVDFLPGHYASGNLLPLNLVFVVDGSGSIAPDMWKAQQDAGIEFIDEFQKVVQGDLRMGIVQFSSDARVEQPLTDDIQAVKNTFSTLQQMNELTYFNNALQFCRDQLDTFPDDSFDVCVLITDGLDMSEKSAQELQGIEKDGAAIFGIYVGDAQDAIDKLKDITMCGAAQPEEGKPCRFFASAQDYSKLQHKAETVATSVKEGLSLATCLVVSGLLALPTMLAMLAPRILWYFGFCTLTMIKRRIDDNNMTNNDANDANNMGGQRCRGDANDANKTGGRGNNFGGRNNFDRSTRQ